MPPPAKKLPVKLMSGRLPWLGAQKNGVGAGGVLSQLGFAALAFWVTSGSSVALTTESNETPSSPVIRGGLSNACHAENNASFPAGTFPDNDLAAAY